MPVPSTCCSTVTIASYPPTDRVFRSRRFLVHVDSRSERAIVSQSRSRSSGGGHFGTTLVGESWCATRLHRVRFVLEPARTGPLEGGFSALGAVGRVFESHRPDHSFSFHRPDLRLSSWTCFPPILARGGLEWYHFRLARSHAVPSSAMASRWNRDNRSAA